MQTIDEVKRHCRFVAEAEPRLSLRETVATLERPHAQLLQRELLLHGFEHSRRHGVAAYPPPKAPEGIARWGAEPSVRARIFVFQPEGHGWTRR